MIHELKTVNPFFSDLMLQTKTFELRKNDRDFRVNDILILQEYSTEEGYTGREEKRKIIYILEDFFPALSKDYVILGISTL